MCSLNKGMKLKNALLIIDMQNDFCSGGTLSVPESDKVVPVINRYIKIFKKLQFPIFASRDWHPKKTRHFKQYGGAWPKHCVQNTTGAGFHSKLKLPKETIILSKGMDPEKDSYSAFQSVDPNGTDFINLLKVFGIKQLYIGGLATDYCVKYTVLDALKSGFKVRLLVDGIKGVNLKPGDSRKAIAKMSRTGVRKTDYQRVRDSFA